MDPVVDLPVYRVGDTIVLDLTIRDYSVPTSFDEPGSIEPLTDPSGAVTVTVTRDDGVAYAGPLTATRTSTGKYQVQIPTGSTDPATFYSVSVSVTHGTDTVVTQVQGAFRLVPRPVAVFELVA